MSYTVVGEFGLARIRQYSDGTYRVAASSMVRRADMRAAAAECKALRNSK